MTSSDWQFSALNATNGNRESLIYWPVELCNMYDSKYKLFCGGWFAV